MLTLISYPAGLGEIAASPFCTKAIWMLNMSGQPWQREDTNDPRKMPHAKLPVLRAGTQMVPDSDNIRTYLEERGADFDIGLSDMEKATSRAFIRMAEEHMYFHLVLDRWGDDAVWPSIRDTYFKDIPKLLRGVVTGQLRKKLLKGLEAQGLGRLSPAERLQRVEPDLKAITTRLWHGPYLFGDQPTGADLSVAAMLGGMRATPGKTLLKTRVAEDEILCRYIDRMFAAMDALSDGSA